MGLSEVAAGHLSSIHARAALESVGIDRCCRCCCCSWSQSVALTSGSQHLQPWPVFRKLPLSKVAAIILKPACLMSGLYVSQASKRQQINGSAGNASKPPAGLESEPTADYQTCQRTGLLQPRGRDMVSTLVKYQPGRHHSSALPAPPLRSRPKSLPQHICRCPLFSCGRPNAQLVAATPTTCGHTAASLVRTGA